MNLRGILFWVALALLAPAINAQDSDGSDLPAAPSATRQQQTPPPPRSAPPQSSSAPLADRAPQRGGIQELKTIDQVAQEQQSAPPATSSEQSVAPVKQEENKPAAPASDSSADSEDKKPVEEKTAGSAATSNDDVDPSLPTIKRVVNEVNVVFTVTDKHGRYIKDLKQNNFKILDDNKPASQVRSFRAETDLPLQVGLLVDASNSVRDRFRFEQEAAIEFMNQIIRPSYDKAFIIGFDTTPEVTQDSTDNTELLSNGVHALRAGGGTAMYDALYFACRDKLRNAPHKGPVRRAIILLSDGEDNQSRVTREEAIEMAQRAEVIIYAISTNVSGTKKQGDRVLERIADATGGVAFFPFQMRDVSNAFTEIQEALRSQYALAYIPEDFRSDGRFRSIQIQADQKQYHVRARHGYYAPGK
jgi:Ca-activated chloride channel family protein